MTASLPIEALEVDGWLAQLKSLEHQGECFRAYDLAMQGLARWPNEFRLAHRAVLALCNAGATGLARKRYAELGLAAQADLDCITLDARIHKAEGLAARGDARALALRRAADRYRDAWQFALREQPETAYFPGINYATTEFLLDVHSTTTRTLATRVQAQVTELLRSDAENYWLWATAIEAALLLRDDERVRECLPRALATGAQAHAQRASTMRQLREILAVSNRDDALIAALRPPLALHYTGLLPVAAHRQRGMRRDEEAGIAERIAAALSARGIGGAYGALAAGSDILFAEQAQRLGIPLHVVLPFVIDDFVRVSVAPFGTRWVDRFHQCLNAAATVRFATDDLYLGDDALFSHGSRMAMGLAVLSAAQLATSALQLAVWDGVDPGTDIGTVADMRIWREAGRAQELILIDPPVEGVAPASRSHSDCNPLRRQARTMLFGDLKHFSLLRDHQIPAFNSVVLKAVGTTLDRFHNRILFVNSWGDGLFIVFADPADAAAAALALQHAMSKIDLAAHDLPKTLGLRIGGHFGPAYCLDDPVQRRPNFFGAQVTRAARIEPVTPEGCVYVTEPFAAALALTHESEFACEYVGMTEAAKSYGAMRMFLLRAKGTPP